MFHPSGGSGGGRNESEKAEVSETGNFKMPLTVEVRRESTPSGILQYPYRWGFAPTRPSQNMKRLVLFDLDGVLLHSQENMRQAWDVVLQKTDIQRPFEDYFGLIGRPFKDIMAHLGVTEDVARIEKIYMTASFDFLSQATFFPGVKEALAELRDLGLKMGVVTSKDAPRTKAVLAQLDVRFASVQSPNERFRGKPAPDHVLLAMAEAGEDPADTLFVGDMETDWQAARRAGIDYVHAGWGYGEPIESIPTLERISQLPNHIRNHIP